MVVVATYIIGCLIWLCNHVLISVCVCVCVYVCCCSVCNLIAQHTRLISNNRLCYYRSSHTFLITDLFAAYHTHLVILNRFCSHVSTQTVHSSEPHAVYRTHLWSGWPFLLCFLITNSSSEWTVCCVSHTPPSGCPFLLFVLIANSSLNWTVCPSSHTQLKPEPCLTHPSSQMFYTFLTVFIQHRLRLWHRTQFLEGSLIVVSR